MRLQSTKPYFCAVGSGGLIKFVALPHLLIALGIEVKILLLYAKDCNGKPALKGNALKKLILFWVYHHQHFVGVQGLEVALIENKTYPMKYRNDFQIISQME